MGSDLMVSKVTASQLEKNLLASFRCASHMCEKPQHRSDKIHARPVTLKHNKYGTGLKKVALTVLTSLTGSSKEACQKVKIMT